jgi:hypothetical protein
LTSELPNLQETATNLLLVLHLFAPVFSQAAWRDEKTYQELQMLLETSG